MLMSFQSFKIQQYGDDYDDKFEKGCKMKIVHFVNFKKVQQIFHTY
jgi:hypothetical protein